MDATATSILKDLKQKKYDPVYLLQGEETYYIDLIADYIEQNVLTDQEKPFNQVVLFGKDIKVGDILVQARRFPVMAERQVVIVKEAQQIADLLKEEGAKKMLLYLKAPVPSTILVLCYKHKTIDKRTAFGKSANQLAKSAIFKKPRSDNRSLTDFVTSYGKDRGFKWEASAAVLLAEHVGNDLHRLAHEMDKIFLDADATQEIVKEQVMDKVGISREYNIFELQKALIQGDNLMLTKIANYFEANTKKSPIIPMVAYLFSFYSKLLIAHGLKDKSARSVAASLKINPYFANDYIYAMKKFNLDKVIAILSMLKQTDLKIKGVNSVTSNDGQLFKELLSRIQHE